ncbi:CCA tRNA nucleotidyltransferase [Cetobacterium somerae]|uniref:CCA tRNA nucleotidyltransferase n=1 Tax=Cetobacterium sp. NK01 TaxID=2993530 RepID=UPI00211610C1|nr:CCA tRNA nucleotidyltransferase [Cetobacterium sp. NK01]MCQ8211647.1 CCA tRNA nucleotidyltransferase [Cetobacterium sp. NK01]
MKKIILTKDIEMILDVLNKFGKGYIVGGYIRDYLLGLEPKDCDFCTDIEYGKLKEIFKDYSPKEIGKAFGIIQIDFNGKKYEIAKLRKDIKFTNFRNILEIEFVEDIKEDLKRRDFTINAIAFNGKELIYNSYLGKKDIENRILRFVGEGEERIKEDPLRILRGIRIAGEKELIIFESTKQDILKCKKEIKRVAIERVQDEFFKILKGKKSSNSIMLLKSLGILKELFPQTNREINENNILNKLKKIDGYKNEDLILKLSIIFLKSQKELEILKLDNKTKKSILNIINNIDNINKESSSYEIKKLILKIGIDDFKSILEIRKLNEDFLNVIIKFKKIIKDKEPIFLKDLLISGDDLIRLGIKDGRKIKKYLDESLEIVLKNPKFNIKEYLLKRIEEDII